MKTRAFFFHYNKPASQQAGEPRLSVHWRDACHIVASQIAEEVINRRIAELIDEIGKYCDLSAPSAADNAIKRAVKAEEDLRYAKTELQAVLAGTKTSDELYRQEWQAVMAIALASGIEYVGQHPVTVIRRIGMLLADKKQELVEAKQIQSETLKRLKDVTYERDILSRQKGKEFWIWQGNDDHLESLTCPVLIAADDLRALIGRPTPTAKTVDVEMEGIANRFLRWPLPESVCSDTCCTRQGPGRVGTNLLSFTETKAMVDDVVRPVVPAGKVWRNLPADKLTMIIEKSDKFARAASLPALK